MVRLFESEEAIVRYIRSSDYDKHDTRTTARPQTEDAEEDAKVGMAVIFNSAPQEGSPSGSWDYTLRFNYTYGVSMLEDQVTPPESSQS